jgi:hypothetical protein
MVDGSGPVRFSSEVIPEDQIMRNLGQAIEGEVRSEVRLPYQ